MLETIRDVRIVWVRGVLLLSLEVVGGILLHPDEAATGELAIVNGVVGLGGKHRLDVVLTITHNESVSISSLS